MPAPPFFHLVLWDKGGLTMSEDKTLSKKSAGGSDKIILAGGAFSVFFLVGFVTMAVFDDIVAIIATLSAIGAALFAQGAKGTEKAQVNEDAAE